MSTKVICEKEDLVAIADATRNITGTTEQMSLNEIANNLNEGNFGTNMEIVQTTGISTTAVMSQAAVTNEIDDIQEEIADEVTARQQACYDLENAITDLGGDVIPTYVGVEAESIADMVLNSRNSNSFVIALASDLHTTGNDTSAIGIKHIGMAMDKINAITQLDLVSLLGDYEVYDFDYGDDDTDGEDARESFKYVNKVFSSVRKGVPFMMLQGNHDELLADTTEEARQKYYAYIGANNVGTVTDYDNKFRNYGYRDFENYKIRVIYLNTADVSDSSVTGSYNVSTEQLNWLTTVALNLTDSEWGIIVLTHHPLNWYGMDSLLNVLDTYKGAGTGAKLIAHFHGHLHNFRVETLGINDVVSITIPNGCFSRNNEYGTSSSYNETIHTNYGDTDASGNQRTYEKISDTAEDTAFNVVVVDMENEKIHAYCYGAGIHRTVTFDGVLTETEKGKNDEPVTPDEPTIGYINQIPLSINADGSEFVGTNGEDGYKVGYRLSTSSGNESAQAGVSVTGYIPIPAKATVRMDDMTFSSTTSTFAVYDSSFAKVNSGYCNTTFTQDANGVWVKEFANAEGYIRISGEFGENPVVTVNEEIV